MEILVINDISWDNFAIVSRRINPKCINPNHKINYFYGKHMQNISNICNQNTFHLVRRVMVKEKEKEIVEDSLKCIKFCLIFHNFIEYNTLSSLYIHLCIKNKISFFIFSEHTDKFYLNGDYISDTKFKSCVREIKSTKRSPIVEIPKEIYFSQEKTCPKNIQEVVNNLRSRYQALRNEKESKQIVYNEQLVKGRKKIIKSDKEMNYLDFMAGKKKWLKETIPKH